MLFIYLLLLLLLLKIIIIIVIIIKDHYYYYYYYHNYLNIYYHYHTLVSKVLCNWYIEQLIIGYKLCINPPANYNGEILTVMKHSGNDNKFTCLTFKV